MVPAFVLVSVSPSPPSPQTPCNLSPANVCSRWDLGDPGTGLFQEPQGEILGDVNNDIGNTNVGVGPETVPGAGAGAGAEVGPEADAGGAGAGPGGAKRGKAGRAASGPSSSKSKKVSFGDELKSRHISLSTPPSIYMLSCRLLVLNSYLKPAQ